MADILNALAPVSHCEQFGASEILLARTMRASVAMAAASSACVVTVIHMP
jgi:hypothetical protein